MRHIYVIPAAELRNILQDNSIQAVTMIHEYEVGTEESSMTILGENESRTMKLKNPLILKGKLVVE